MIIGLLGVALIFMVWLIGMVFDTGEIALLIPVALFAFIPVWLIFGEFRTRTVSVWIEGDTIMMTNYLGLGIRKTYSFSEFDGFNTVALPSRYDEFEYLFLLKNGKRLISISEFYHSNYKELKAGMKGKVRNLGRIKYSFVAEFKDIFR
jgi:hypothetical protein